MLSNKLTLYYSKKWGKRGGRNILNMKQATLFFHFSCTVLPTARTWESGGFEDKVDGGRGSASPWTPEICKKIDRELGCMPVNHRGLKNTHFLFRW